MKIGDKVKFHGHLFVIEKVYSDYVLVKNIPDNGFKSSLPIKEIELV